MNNSFFLHYQTKGFCFFSIFKKINFFSYVQKMAVNNYKKTKEMLQRTARENYQNLPEEEKNIKREYAHSRYRKPCRKNKLSEEEKKQKR